MKSSRRSQTMAIFWFLLLLCLIHASHVVCQTTTKSTTWRTLSGDAPVVIARGGVSGIFPDSSLTAYQVAALTSLPDLILWCDVQLTKDGSGICAPDVKLDNCTNIASVYPNNKTTYLVNGMRMGGWFSVDYSLKDLQQIEVVLTQAIYSRTYRFDGITGISTVEQVSQQVKPRGYWLNIQHDSFFSQHNLNMRSFVISVSKRVVINYISSPEVGFLRSIVSRFKGSPTKLVLRFLGADVTDPSTNQTYASLLKNLTFVKTFASGILVPKIYIWPVDSGLYLLPHTTIVSDAHKEGLEVFAADFVNDAPFSFNFSYDPLAEALAFIDNGDFSVDGVLSDFPITPSEAVGCFSHLNKSGPKAEKPVIISHNGASGIYPGSTDLAYQQAVDDGTDFIDCSVQMTKDGVPICLNSINLMESTNVVQSRFSSRLINIPEIPGGAQIFTFNFTWAEIQTLKPAISNPYLDFKLRRNPAYSNAGNFMTLSDFLKFGKSKQIAGIMITIENAAYLAEKQGLRVTNAVIDALTNVGYSNHTAPDVIIQSTNSSVLDEFKKPINYKCMYMVDESIRDALNSSLEDIKRFADYVSISKDSVYPENKAFLIASTKIVQKLQAFGLPVYVYTFRNEFVAQAWDFYSDATVEINSFFQGAGVDGIITDFPGTASRYRKSPCLQMGNKMPNYMVSVPPGGLLTLMNSEQLPPTQAPLPVLTDSDVEEPPLPSGLVDVPSSSGYAQSPTSPSTPTSLSAPNGQPRLSSCTIIMAIAMLLALLLP